MRTRTKVWLIIAASLVLIGCILFAGVMASLKWDWGELATVQYETNTYIVSEVFDRISINADTADVDVPKLWTVADVRSLQTREILNWMFRRDRFCLCTQ